MIVVIHCRIELETLAMESSEAILLINLYVLSVKLCICTMHICIANAKPTHEWLETTFLLQNKENIYQALFFF